MYPSIALSAQSCTEKEDSAEKVSQNSYRVESYAQKSGGKKGIVSFLEVRYSGRRVRYEGESVVEKVRGDILMLCRNVASGSFHHFSSPFCTLFIWLALLGEEGDVVLHGPDGKSGKG